LKWHHHPLNEQDFALFLNKHACCDLGVLKMDTITRRAHSAWSTEARLDLDCGAALRTILNQLIHVYFDRLRKVIVSTLKMTNNTPVKACNKRNGESQVAVVGSASCAYAKFGASSATSSPVSTSPNC
jgi:hypothetical protein